jgi:hypothetical protein
VLNGPSRTIFSEMLLLESAVTDRRYDVAKALLELKANPHARMCVESIFQDILDIKKIKDKSALPLI